MSLRRRDPLPGLSHDQVAVSPAFEPPPAHRDGLRRVGALRSVVVGLSGAGQGGAGSAVIGLAAPVREDQVEEFVGCRWVVRPAG